MKEIQPTFYFVKFSSDASPVRLCCREWRQFMVYMADEMQKRGIVEWMILE